jgi:hypothetical protein
MKITRVIAIALLAASVGITSLQAQSREQQPAEFPPLTYKGKQYVDSRGCVFIRAGIDGNVTWVPRVSRARKAVCGFQPTNVGSIAENVSPKTAESPAVEITLNETVKPAPKPKVAPAPAPVPVPAVKRSEPVRKVAPVVAKAPVRKAPVAPVVVATPDKAQVTISCPGASPLSGQYLRGNGKLAVRCGPQSTPIIGARISTTPPPVTRISSSSSRANVPAQGNAAAARAPVAVAPVVTAQTRIVPKHVAINRQHTGNLTVPKGYRKVWEDDRLNPHRAEQTLAGRADMLLIWTQTVPRRLVNQATGRDLTASVPLVYPYLDLATQRRELGEVRIVQRDGTIVKQVIRNRPRAVHSGVREPIYSTRSAERPLADAAPKVRQRGVAATSGQKVSTARHYVQIGSFLDPANAQRSAKRVAGMGMPARIGKQRQGGKTYMVVQAGPFPHAAVETAVGKLRKAGYRDAFVR